MSEFEGAEEDEEWLEMVKEQMISEGAEISVSRSKSMIGLSRVLDEPHEPVNLDASTVVAGAKYDDESSVESEILGTQQRRFSRPRDPSTVTARLKARSASLTANLRFIKVKLQPWLKTRQTVTHAELSAATKQASEDLEKFRTACREVVIKLTSNSDTTHSWVSTSILRKLEDGPNSEEFIRCKQTHD